MTQEERDSSGKRQLEAEQFWSVEVGLVCDGRQTRSEVVTVVLACEKASLTLATAV